jgi:hypothetical protein
MRTLDIALLASASGKALNTVRRWSQGQRGRAEVDDALDVHARKLGLVRAHFPDETAERGR